MTTPDPPSDPNPVPRSPADRLPGGTWAFDLDEVGVEARAMTYLAARQALPDDAPTPPPATQASPE